MEEKPQNLALQGMEMSLLTLPCWSPTAPGPLLQTPFQRQTLQMEFKRAGSTRMGRFLKDFTQNFGSGVKPQGFVPSFLWSILIVKTLRRISLCFFLDMEEPQLWIPAFSLYRKSSLSSSSLFTKMQNAFWQPLSIIHIWKAAQLVS